MNRERRHDIDWIRVIAFDLLILYHVGMLFVPWGYHIKNNDTSEAFVIPMSFLNQWRLPILFVVSGMGTRFALSFRSGKKYISERLTRLLIPLIFGILFIVSPQVYFERLSQGANYNSFFEFYPNYFNGIYPTGNFSWHHLWFITYLLFYSLIFIPVFLFIRDHPNLKILSWLKFIIKKHPFFLYLFTLPLIAVEYTLKPIFPMTLAFYGDWYILSFYAVFFFYGFILISIKEIVLEAFEKSRLLFLVLAIFFTIVLIWSWSNEINGLLRDVLRIFNLWSWILAIFGFSSKFLNRPSKILAYRNRAVYPFYILHQTIIIVTGYHLKDLHLSIPIKFLITVVVTFLGCWIIYEFIIIKIKVIQPLFGLTNPKTKANKT